MAAVEECVKKNLAAKHRQGSPGPAFTFFVRDKFGHMDSTPLNTLTLAKFAPLIHTRFKLLASDAAEVELELIEATRGDPPAPDSYTA